MIKGIKFQPKDGIYGKGSGIITDIYFNIH